MGCSQWCGSALTPSRNGRASSFKKRVGFIVLAGHITVVGFAQIADILSRDEQAAVSWVPDDYFYYQASAQNYIEYGNWSASGYEPTSGVHLVWAQLLMVLFRSFPNLTLVHTLAVLGAFSFFVFGLFVLSVYALVPSRFATVATVFLGAVVASPLAVRQIDLGMEGLFSASLAGLAVFVAVNSWSGKVAAGMLFISSGLASLSRIDVGFALTLVFFIFSLVRADGARRVVVVGVSGTLCGLATVTLWQWKIFGRFISASAETKVRMSVGRSSLFESTSLNWMLSDHLTRVGAVPYGTATLLFATSLVIALGAVIFRQHVSMSFAVFAAALFGLIQANSATHLWYGGIAIVAIGSLVCATITLLAANAGQRLGRAGHGLAVLFGLSTLVMQLPLEPLGAPWPHHEAMYATLAAAQLPEDSLVGTWNSGLSHSYAKWRTVNLDGLANDESAKAIGSGSIVDYIESVGISFLFDWGRMWDYYIPLAYGQDTLTGLEEAFPYTLACSEGGIHSQWEGTGIILRAKSLEMLDSASC